MNELFLPKSFIQSKIIEEYLEYKTSKLLITIIMNILYVIFVILFKSNLIIKIIIIYINKIKL